MLSIIAALSDNYVIGSNHELPWHLPKDFQRLKEITIGKTIIMGRATYESIGKPLPKRRNIIITRQTGYQVDGAEVVHSLKEALTLVKDEDEAIIFGGAQIYKLAFAYCDRMYLTIVHTNMDGDAHFPRWSEQEWHAVSSEHHAADEKHAFSFSFYVYERT